MPLGLMCFDTPDGGQPYRIINLDLMATAAIASNNPEWTEVFCVGGSVITLHQPFAEFLKQVQDMIARSYRIELQAKAQWQEKYTKDHEATLRSVLQDLHPTS